MKDEFDVTARKKKIFTLDDHPSTVKKKKKKVVEPELKKKKKADVEDPPVVRKKKKKVKVEEVDAPTLKKKKKKKVKVEDEPSTALVINKKQLKKISKLVDGKYESILGDSSEDIQQLLESNDADSATALIQKRLLQSLVDLLPMAEHNVRKTEGAKGVYQINSLISSIREVMTDIQALRDRGLIGQSMLERIIQPFMLDLGMQIVQEFSNLVQDTTHLVPAENHPEFRKAVVASRTRIGQYINDRFAQDLRPNVIDFLQR